MSGSGLIRGSTLPTRDPLAAAPDFTRTAMTAARVAGVLFVTATAATMAGQTMIAPFSQAPEAIQPIGGQRILVSVAILLEIANALSSAGIAIALHSILRRCSEIAATGYLGLRLIESALGVAATVGLLMLLTDVPMEQPQAVDLHDQMFLLVLIVFSCGTLLLYPVLFRFRLVPTLLSVWGLVGGLMLLTSCLLILFGQIETGSVTDMVLSLPIWINEMALAGWLILRGVNLQRVPVPQSPRKGALRVG